MTVEDEIRDALNVIRDTDTGSLDTEAISEQVQGAQGKQFTEISVTEEFDPITENGSIMDLTQTRELTDGSQLKIHYSKRPRCPNCQHLPLGEEEHPGLVGTCTRCGTRTCSNCHNSCDYCGENLCNHCITSYASSERNPEQLAMCSDCAETQGEIDEFERNLRAWQIQLEQQVELISKQIQFKELEFDKEKQRRQMEAELEIDRMQKAIEAEKVKNERRKIEIEETKVELKDQRERQRMQLKQEIQRREKRLEEFEAKVDAELRQQELNIEREEMLKEQKLEEKKQQLEALNSLMELSKQRKEQTRKDWELLMDTRERMRELKWDEANDFLDFAGRLQNQDFQRLEGDDDEEEMTGIPIDEDEDVYVIPNNGNDKINNS